MSQDKQPVYKQPFRSEIVDLPVLVESLHPLDDSLDYILAVKDGTENGEFAHYNSARVKELKANIDQAYHNLPDYVRPLIMNEMLSLWTQLSSL